MNNTTNVVIILDLKATADLSLIQSPAIVGYFYLWGYMISFILGFIGNIASLLTFSRKTLRTVSTGCLFIILAVSDTFYLLASIFDFINFGLQIPINYYINYDRLCQFRTFILSGSQMYSAWILVVISIDRWIRTRYPIKSFSLCTKNKALIKAAVLLIIVIALNSHILTPLFGSGAPRVALIACGPKPTEKEYLNFYYFKWVIIQIFTTCLIPVIMMLFILFHIFILIRTRKQSLGQKRNNRIQRQMFFLMFSNIILFILTTLPLSVYRIILPKQITWEFYTQIMINSAALTWILSLNYAINFYIYCLSSTLFRTEFRLAMKIFFCKKPSTVVPF